MINSLARHAFRKFRQLETNLHELNYLFWECTTRCNLNCLHCGSDCSRNSTTIDMPLHDFLRALETIKNPAKNLIVVLTGGEPLLRRDLAECGREIRKRGIRWGLVTNGQLYDEIRHNELLNAGLGALTISLDGLEDSHNWLRNAPGSFGKVEKALSLAANSGRLNFDVVTCVNQKNLRELPEIKSYLQAKGVKAWRLFTIVPIGRAADHPELFLDKAQLKEMFEFIKASRKNPVMDVKFSCEGYTGSYEMEVRDSFFLCRAGINIASVLADGSISACPNIDRSLSQGNIYRDDFYGVWHDRFLPFRDRSWTRKGKCAVCPDYRDCLGSGMHNWHGEKSEVLICHRQV